MKKFVYLLTCAASLICVFVFSAIIYYDFTLPDSYYVQSGEKLSFNSQADIISFESGEASFVSKSVGSSKQTCLKLFGKIPIKNVKVTQVNAPLLVPGGTPFGIKLLTQGVVVVGISDVSSVEGCVCPAKEAGLKVGDVIISINKNSAVNNGGVAQAVKKSDGKPMEFTVLRKEKELKLTVTPVFSSENKCFQAGIWVRDSSAGIGTVTYYDPQTSAFGGLGHPVCDIDTGEIMPLMSGEVVPVKISGAVKSVAGSPGELVGGFVSEKSVGNILTNNENGIFGTLDSSPSNFEAVPMGFKQEIVCGKATIISTVDESGPKEYDIEITEIDPDSKNSSKNMVIKVTDKELLEKTGGIVQGMSGSPIIQNGKLIGAVTHVFVNEPTQGFGIFCENMYNYSKNVKNQAA